MSSKTIKVNPIFLSTNGGLKNNANKTRKEKPTGVSLGQSNSIKKKLIARIKNFQHGKKEASTNNSSTSNAFDEEDAFKNEFSNSMQFLDGLASDKQDHKQNNRLNQQRNSTLKKKQTSIPAAYMQIATELPPELWERGITSPGPPLIRGITSPGPPPIRGITSPGPPLIRGITSPDPLPSSQSYTIPSSAPGDTITQKGGLEDTITQKGGSGGFTPRWSPPPQPLYSNLKNSNSIKPTYRTWLRTTQKNKPVTTKPPINILEDMGTVVLTQESPVNQVPVNQVPVNQVPVNQVPAYKPSMPRRKKITRTYKYKLGKHANGKVSVLIKNAQTRRKIQTEQSMLKRKSILDVKNHLRSRNLLKVGSNAPNDVLREIYEQSILAGQIENKAKETLIHNYFNGADKIN